MQNNNLLKPFHLHVSQGINKVFFFFFFSPEAIKNWKFRDTFYK